MVLITSGLVNKEILNKNELIIFYWKLKLLGICWNCNQENQKVFL